MISWRYKYVQLFQNTKNGDVDLVDSQGCSITNGHTNETPREAPKTTSTTTFTVSDTPKGGEVYTSTPLPIQPSTPPPAPQPIVDEEDDASAIINPGTACRRTGCKTIFVSDEINRLGDGEGTVCQYHPAPVRTKIP